MRAILSSLGIAIGIAAMISVIGISTSSQALIKEKLADLGTNLLTVSGGTDLLGQNTPLSPEALALIRRIPGVQHASSTATLEKIFVFRNAQIEPSRTGGLSVAAADLDLLEATGSTILTGTWLNEATAQFPTVVLGRTAAERLGVQTAGGLVWLGNHQFTVVGILDSSPLVPELDSMALIGESIAQQLFGYAGNPTTIYERSDEARVIEVQKTAATDRQPRFAERGEGQPPVRRLGRAEHRRPGIHRAARRGRLDRAARRRHRRGQHHGHLGARTAPRDRPAPFPRRHPHGTSGCSSCSRRCCSPPTADSPAPRSAGSSPPSPRRSNGWVVAIPPEVLVAGIAVTIAVGAIAGVCLRCGPRAPRPPRR